MESVVSNLSPSYCGKLMRKSEAGQGLVDYNLILILVAIVVMAVLIFLGPGEAQDICDEFTSWPLVHNLCSAYF